MASTGKLNTGIRSPVRWLGGKTFMLKRLLPIFTKYPHKRYVEPFGGAATVLLAKPPVEIEVYNDLDDGLVNFFKVVADERTFDRFRRKVSLLPYARSLWEECRDTWNDQTDPVERAVRWFVVMRQTFGGVFAKSWGSAVTTSARGMVSTCSAWLRSVELLPELHARLQRVQIERLDFRRCIERYDGPETLFYCDPPYITGLRRGGRYREEMSDDDHRDLVELLLTIEGHAVLSGYPNEIYRPLEEAGWERFEFDVVCRAAAKTRVSGLLGEGCMTGKQRRIEAIWCSPEPNLLQGEMFR